MTCEKKPPQIRAVSSPSSFVLSLDRPAVGYSLKDGFVSQPWLEEHTINALTLVKPIDDVAHGSETSLSLLQRTGLISSLRRGTIIDTYFLASNLASHFLGVLHGFLLDHHFTGLASRLLQFDLFA